MITLAGSTNLSFVFPAQLKTAFAYYGDIERTLLLLPHISLIGPLGVRQYRMMYSTIELGIYRVRMICDIQVQLDEARGMLRIDPVQGSAPVKSKITFNSLTAQGYYRSQSVFHPGDDENTAIDYRLKLDASLPIPIGARFMPGSVLNSIARNIANWRIHEIAQGFISRSIEDYLRQSEPVTTP